MTTSVRIHHLNCGSLCPPGEVMVCHVLLVETATGLVLVDTGFGLADSIDPSRVGPVRHLLRPRLDPSETARRQIRALGLDPADVTDIVLTHADVDHAGGVADFPGARVHLLSAEQSAVRRPRGILEARRYRWPSWATSPRVIAHPPGANNWLGFDGVVNLDQVVRGMALIPLPGHTAGHAGVVLPVEDGWLLHAADAFHSLDSLLTRQRPDVRVRQGILAHDARALRRTQRQLSDLAQHHPDVQMINSHDRGLWAASAR